MDNSYKLDYSYTLNGKKYNLKDCSGYRSGFSRDYSLLNGIYYFYSDNNKMGEITKNFDYTKMQVRQNEKQSILECVKKFVDAGGIHNVDEPTEYRSEYWEARRQYEILMADAILRTNEYVEASQKFVTWYKDRPGVKASWQEYVKKANTRDQTYKYPIEPTLEVLSENFQNTQFRRILEYRRPDKYVAGDIVALTAMYKNKRNKDPYYYKYEEEIRNAERVGTVLKKEEVTSYGNFGAGSRQIRVLWFASGEETKIEEKCLKYYTNE